MSKIGKCLLLTSALSLGTIFSVQATLKFDVSKPITKVTQNIEKIQGIAADTQKQLEHIKTYQKFDAAKEEYNKAVEGINSVKSSAEGLKGSVEDGISQASALTGEMTDAQQLINLQTQQAEAKLQYEKEVKELEDSRDAQIKKLEQNRATWMADVGSDPSLQKNIDEANEEIEKLKKHYDELLADKKLVFERSQNSLTGQMNKIKAAAANIDPLGNTVDSATKAIGSLFSGNAATAMGEMIAKNFYSADALDYDVKIEQQIMDYRFLKEREDTTDAYTEAVRITSAGDEHLVYADKLSINTQATETEPAAIMLDTSIKVEQMRELLKFARLLAAEMKMETAKDMVGLSKHLNNYEKDVQNFRMDDYNVDAKKSVKDKLKNLSLSDIKKTASDVKGKIDDAKEMLNDVQDSTEIIKGFGG